MEIQHPGKIHIGTSGWHYKNWMGSFYPDGIKSPAFLDYYVKFFRTVEINNSFYRLPSRGTFALWKRTVPHDFVYAVKANQFITHMKQLREPKQHFNNFIGHADALEEKLGPILFQLPPDWNFNYERLVNFVNILPSSFRYAIEFRNYSWYNQQVYDLLHQKNIAFCIYEIDDHMSPMPVTAEYLYVRLHGPAGECAGSYNESALARWVSQCKTWTAEGRDVYFFFDNNQQGYAACNAQRMLELAALTTG